MSLDFGKFTDNVLAEIVLSEDETSFLKALSSSAGRYPDFVKILEENPAVESNLLNAANRAYSGRLGELITSTEVALGMMGYRTARNYLAASIIRKNHHINPWDNSINVVLKYALEAEVAGGPLGPRYFCAGLVFDIILYNLIKPDGEGKLPPTPKFVIDLWKHSLQVCAIGRQLVNRLYPTGNIEKDICVHTLLHDVGKIACYLMDEEIMALQFKAQLQAQIKKAKSRKATTDEPAPPAGPAVDEKPKEADAPPKETSIKDQPLLSFPEERWVTETEKYGISHDMVGHLILWTLGYLPDTTWIVLYHHQPYLASRRGDTIYKHTIITWLADQICRYREINRTLQISGKMIEGWYHVTKPLLPDVPEAQFRNIINTLVFT